MYADTAYTTRYGEISWPAGRRARNFLRYQLLNGLSMFRSAESLKQPHIQFLYFHHIFNDELAGLAGLLEMLSKYYRFISYSEAVTRLETGAIDAAYICFSSDDGFRNNLNGAELFRQYGISCCYFVCPAMVGVKDAAAVSSFCSSRLHLPPVAFLDWDDIAELQRAGHEIGNHTNRHQRLSELDAGRQEEEISLAHEAILARCGSVSHFAFPYGLYSDLPEQAHEQVKRLGYRSCASAVRGAYLPGTGGKDLRSELIRRDQVIFHHSPRHAAYFISANLMKAARPQ